MTSTERNDKFEVSRRAVLSGVLGASIAAGFVSSKEALAQENPLEVDVVVVGAGASGCFAARKLVAEGYRVAVLEADDRPGGRLRRGEVNGEPVDLGGQWWGPGQTLLDTVSKELGLTRLKQNISGKNILNLPGMHIEYEGEVPNLPEKEMEAFASGMTQLETWAAEIDPSAPWKHPRAKEWDSITCHTWMSQNLGTDFVSSFFKFAVKGVCVVDPSQISLLQFLFYCRSGQSLTTLISTDGGAQQEVFKGGLFQVPLLMAAALGDAVHLSTHVQKIKQDDEGVTVSTNNGTWRAKRVIVAAPPTMAQRIQFDPPLPAMRDVYMQRAPMGSVIKFYVAYDTPFWREKGYSGQAFFEGDANVFFEHALNGSGKFALVGFMDGESVLRWADRTTDERRDYVVSEVVRIFGDAGAKPVDYVDRAWSADPFRRGGYGTQPSPGTWTIAGEAWNRPVGNVHWAGSDTSEIWNGYVEGALQAGLRAANQVKALL